MKFYKSLVLLALSNTAFAATPSRDAKDLNRILVNNPEIYETIRTNYTAGLTSMTQTTQINGVRDYKLEFEMDCFCPYKKITIQVSENLIPMLADGLPEYQYTIKIEQ